MGWLSSFKALSWALGRGALCSQRFTLSQFALVYSLPITPLHSPSHGSTSGGSPSPAPAGSTRRATRSAAKASLASGASDASLTSGGGGGAMLPRRGSRGRLAEDAGGSSTMASNWAVKNALLAAVLVALRHQLPGFLESLAFGGCQRRLRAPAPPLPSVLLLAASLVSLPSSAAAHLAHACLQAWACLYCCPLSWMARQRW